MLQGYKRARKSSAVGFICISNRAELGIGNPGQNMHVKSCLMPAGSWMFCVTYLQVTSALNAGTCE